MDLSPEYIKMCEKAKEIQAMMSFENDEDRHNYWACPFCGDIADEYLLFSGKTGCTEQDVTPVWLPRLDQLIEMISGMDTKDPLDVHLTLGILDALYGLEQDREGYEDFNSVEQAFLSFVMENKFNKRWSCESWQENED